MWTEIQREITRTRNNPRRLINTGRLINTDRVMAGVQATFAWD
jgi:hypothetical protein